MPVKGADLLEACRGELLQGDPEQIISGFSIDTRTIQRGDFFIPLRGEQELAAPLALFVLAAPRPGCRRNFC